MKLKKDNIIIFFLLLFLLKPVGIDLYSTSLNNIMNVLKTISMVYITVIFVNHLKNGKKISDFIVLMLIIEALSIYVCIINNSSCYSAIIYWHTIFCVIFLAEINKEKNLYDFLKISLLVYKIYVLINFITILMWPNGYNDTRMYFLGNKTMQILYILPLLFLQFIDTELYSKNKYSFNNILFISIALYTMYVNPSSTSIIAVLLSLLYYVFFYKKTLEKLFSKCSCKFLSITIIVASCALIFGSSLGGLSAFISNLFGKDATFTGRVYIWESAIRMIKAKPFGYGWDQLVTGVTGIFYWGGEITSVGHAHNLLLTLGYKLGIIGVIVYLILLWLIAKKIDDKESYINESVCGFLKIYIFIFLIISITESYPTNCAGLYLILYLCVAFYKYKVNKE